MEIRIEKKSESSEGAKDPDGKGKRKDVTNRRDDEKSEGKMEQLELPLDEA